MKTKFTILLFLFIVQLFSCGKKIENTNVITDLYTDFPECENLDMEYFNTYKYFLEDGNISIRDSVLWYFTSNNDHSLGKCFNLYTGKEISTIGTIGKAKYEFTKFPAYGCVFMGDSIQFRLHRRIIKTFSINEIVENRSMEERNFSITTTPDSLNVAYYVKLPNGSVLATLEIGAKQIDIFKNKFNENSIAVYNEKEAKAYETIDYKSYGADEWKSPKDIELEYNESDMIKLAYSYCRIATKDSDYAAFVDDSQALIYTFDIKNGKVLKEKRYAKLKEIIASNAAPRLQNELSLALFMLGFNDKYIFLEADGYFSYEDKEAERMKNALLVFDWDLNPIKMYDLPELRKKRYLLSKDCKTFYSYTWEDDIILSKVDLNLE